MDLWLHSSACELEMISNSVAYVCEYLIKRQKGARGVTGTGEQWGEGGINGATVL